MASTAEVPSSPGPARTPPAPSGVPSPGPPVNMMRPPAPGGPSSPIPNQAPPQRLFKITL